VGEVSFHGGGEILEHAPGLLAAGSRRTVRMVATNRLPSALCVPNDSFRQITACRSAALAGVFRRFDAFHLPEMSRASRDVCRVRGTSPGSCGFPLNSPRSRRPSVLKRESAASGRRISSRVIVPFAATRTSAGRVPACRASGHDPGAWPGRRGCRSTPGRSRFRWGPAPLELAVPPVHLRTLSQWITAVELVPSATP